MKNKILIVVFAFAATSFVSCKKDYYCECQKIYTGSSSSSQYDDGVYTYHDSRARAEDKCNQQETSGSDLGGDYTRECQIR